MEGGLRKWMRDGFPTTDQPTEAQKREYNAGQWKRRDSMVITSNEMKEHVRKASESLAKSYKGTSAIMTTTTTGDVNNNNTTENTASNETAESVYHPSFAIIDTRSQEQYLGLVEHPKGYHIGHIAGSLNIQPEILVNPETKTARKPHELRRIVHNGESQSHVQHKLLVFCAF